MPAVCLPFFCYCVRSLRHILVPGYALLPRLLGVQCLRLGCVFPVRIFAQVFSCAPLDLLLLFLHPSHSLRLAHAVFVAFAGFPRARLARPLLPLPRRPSHVFASAWCACVFWHASCVCTCYIAVARGVPCAFRPKVKSVFVARLSNNPLADDVNTLEPTSLPPPATSSKEGSRVVAMALLPGNPGDASRCIGIQRVGSSFKNKKQQSFS